MYKKILSALAMCFALSSVNAHDECIFLQEKKPDFTHLIDRCVTLHQHKKYGRLLQINNDFKKLIQQYAKFSDEGDPPSKCTQFFSSLHNAMVKYKYQFCIPENEAGFVNTLKNYQPFTLTIDPSDYVRARIINDITNWQAYWVECKAEYSAKSDCSTRLCHLMTDGSSCDSP